MSVRRPCFCDERRGAGVSVHPGRTAFEEGVRVALVHAGPITAVMEILDTTIVNVALPQIAGNLSAARGKSWVARLACLPTSSCCR
jgi:hypothetical protein